MDISVFYAWQDDRPGKSNRYLIRDAAKGACQRITGDVSNDYVVLLDEATAGAPGMCDIPNTILEKIRNCDVFLADLTFVGKTDARSNVPEEVQLVSNPNVLFELGYAARRKDFDRILGVMNVAYGKPERQMFDTKRRWAIQYNLPEDSSKSERQSTQKSLSKEIEEALLTILDKAVLPEKAEDASDRFNKMRSEFESSVRDGSFHEISNNAGAIAICLIPDVGQTLDYAKMAGECIHPPGASGWNYVNRGKSVLAVCDCDNPRGKDPPRVRSGVAEMATAGVIFCADTLLLDPALRRFLPRDDEDLRKIIPSYQFEKEVIRSVERYAETLNKLGVSPPWRLGVSLVGIRGYRMETRHALERALDHTDSIVADPVTIRSFDDIWKAQSSGHLLKDTFDYISRECGFPGSENHDAEGNWIYRG